MATSCLVDFGGTLNDSNSKYTFNSFNWIIDSGTSSHKTGTPEVFSELREVKGRSTVHLPDGSVKQIMCIGDVVLNEKLILKDVLYVPEFKYNLISVCKLATVSDCSFVFYSYRCIVQNQVIKEVVAEGLAKKNLYILEVDKGLISYVSNGKIDAWWHERLGHPSTEVLSRLSLHCKHDGTKVCNTCHSAKQTRLPFGQSSIRSTKCFELIHMDIWVLIMFLLFL